MKKEFLKIAGVKTEQEFYDRYPSEEDFFKAHPNALKQLARGGEAYPQTATMDNFFSYGVPVPPTYYRHGGAFPMAQSEDQFFSPFYGNVPNPYNKAMGGSSEPYRQAMSFPYGNTGRSTHFMMQDGGDMSEEQTLPKMGVNGKLLEFVGTLKNTAANKLNSNLRMYGKVKNPEQYEFEKARYGGNLRNYQSRNSSSQTDPLLDRVTKGMGNDPLFTNRMNLPQLDYNSDKGTVNNYYYGPGAQGPGGGPYFDGAENGLPPEYYNDIDYLRGRRRPLSDFDIKGKGMFGNYSSTGWLKDEYGMDRLREMGLTRMDQSNPRWWQLMKRPTQTYYFGNQGQGPMGYVPGQVDQQGMPITQTNQTNQTNQNTQTNQTTQTPPGGRQGSGMGLLARMFNRDGNMAPNPANIVKDYKDVNPDQNTIVDTNNPAGWNPYMSDFRNQVVQNRRRRTFDKLADLTAHETWQKDMLGKAYDAMEYKPEDASGQEISRDSYSDIGLQGRRKRKQDRLNERALNLDRKVNAQRFQGKETSSEKESRREKRIREQTTSPSSYQQYRKPMTLDEYNKQKEIEARDKAGIEQQIKDSNNLDTPMAPMQGVTDRQQIGNQPTGHTTIILNESKGKSSAPYSYSPAFDEQLAKDIISSNEQNFFRTKSIDEPFDPSKHSANWQDYSLDNFPGESYKKPGFMDAYWNKMFSKNGKKEKTWNQFNDMPAPLRTVAADIMYNQKTDPREILLAAAGVPQMGAFSKYAGDYSMTGDAGRSNRRAIKDDVDKLWRDNKDMILQQYNDDPRAFTDAFSDYRDVYLQNTRTSDIVSRNPEDPNNFLSIETDTLSNTGYPGSQYKAWHGRSENTRNMVDDKYFGPNSGYVAPQFAGGGSYNAGDVVDMTPEELQRFIAMGGQVEFLD